MKHDLLRLLLTAAAITVLGTAPVLQAQTPVRLPPDSIVLTDLSAFASPPGSWRVVGSVSADRTRDHRVDVESGVGVLVNVAEPGSGGDLRTVWEHGDIDLELEFMVPRASNSGIYFQGRYELQLLDSWGVERPTYSDVGGIYERWDDARGAGKEGYEGRAPRVNAARAPGLWQTLRVEFRAPRFDEQGRKVANARFARVELNGAVLHENVELTGPTRGASQPGEAAMGPLVIQGDHGPIAFRNISYKRYGTRPLELSGLLYRVYEGSFNRLPEVASLTPARSGVAAGLSTSSAGVADAFALVQDGMIEVPTGGRHLLELRLNWLDGGDGGDGTQGGARLEIAGREVLVHTGRTRSATAEVELPAGRHAFSLALFKNREGRPASFTLFVEGPGVARQALHAEAPAPRGSPTGAIRVELTDEPYLLRGFVEHAGEKRTHVISVGDPAGIHYSYDAESGAVLSGWRGPFLETTQMWEGRGEPQLAVPLGSVLSLSAEPTLARLGSVSTPWPDSIAPADYQFLGYDLDEARRPVFRYRLGALQVEDRIRPADERRGLARQIQARAAADPGVIYARLATGESIERLRDGSYLVDGSYYLVPARDTADPIVRPTQSGQELLVPLRFRSGSAALNYEIVW